MSIDQTILKRFNSALEAALEELRKHPEFGPDGKRTYNGNSLPFGDGYSLNRNGTHSLRADMTGFELGKLTPESVIAGYQVIYNTRYGEALGREISGEEGAVAALEEIAGQLERAVNKRITEGSRY